MVEDDYFSLLESLEGEDAEAFERFSEWALALEKELIELRQDSVRLCKLIEYYKPRSKRCGTTSFLIEDSKIKPIGRL